MWFYAPLLLVGLFRWSPIAFAAWWRALKAKPPVEDS
jgi:hypothetical protein